MNKDTEEEEELCYLYSENRGADQLCSYCTADLHPGFSHDVAHMSFLENSGARSARFSVPSNLD